MKSNPLRENKVVWRASILGLLVFLSLPSQVRAAKAMDWIRVEGNRFVKASGETVVFRGVNIRDPHDLERQGRWQKAHFQEAKNWGANVIRLPIHPRTWRERGQEGYVADTYPVILTEIGFALPDEKGAHIPVNGDETYGRALVDYAAAKGVSWVAWCFNPDWPPTLFTDWDYTPSRQGAFFKKVMQAAP